MISHLFSSWSVRRAILILMVTLALAVLVSSQQPGASQAGVAAIALAQASDTPFLVPFWDSAIAGNAQSIAWGDMNNDGTLDLAVGNGDASVGQFIRLYRNDGFNAQGKPQMTLVWTSANLYKTTSLAWGDMDGDGDLDLAVGNNGQPIILFRNDGANAKGEQLMALVWSSSDGGGMDIAWGDMDGDSDLDLVIGSTPFRMYRNNGQDAQGNPLMSSYTLINNGGSLIALGDMDSDGDLDFAGNGCLYRNDGLNPQGYPQITFNSCLPSEFVCTFTDPAWGDVNKDGKLDLAVGCDAPRTGGPNFALYTNLGVDAQGFTLMSYRWFPSTSGALSIGKVAWGDMDGDRDLDLVVGNSLYPTMVFRNDGGTLTSTPVWSAEQADQTLSIAVGDMDGDGNLDIAEGNDGPPARVYHNNSITILPNDPLQSPVSSFGDGLALGDMDGDGDLDIATNGNLLRNIGVNAQNEPQFTSVWTNYDCGTTPGVAWGDMDNDGDLDLVLACYSGTLVYRNDGQDVSGNQIMTLFWSSAEPDQSESFALGDMDGDGDLDLVVGNNGQVSRIYRNDGVGITGNLRMTLNWSSSEIAQTTSIALGDVDNDGDLDLAVGNYDRPNRLYRNDGTDALGNQQMALIWSSAESDPTNSIAWGDFDNDGKLDLAIGNFGQPGRLYRNDRGSLSVNAAWTSTEFDDTTNIAFGDVDGDGDLDLATSNISVNPYRFTQPTRLYRNDGGSLTPGAAWSSLHFDSLVFDKRIAWGDMDGDGDLDLILNGEGIHIYLNSRDAYNLPGAIPLVSVRRPGINADFYSNPKINTGPIIPVEYSFPDLDVTYVQSMRAEFSLNGGGQWETAAEASGPYMDIPVGKMVESNLTILANQTISDLNVWLSIGSPVKSGLLISLIAPDGSSAVLVSGGEGIYDHAIFDDSATRLISLSTSPYKGRFRPEEALSRFIRKSTQGTWKLRVENALDKGALLAWGLDFTVTGGRHVFNWDVYQSGFFGRSDNVVFRLTAFPAIINKPRAIAGPYMRGSYASSTFPFRVRGTQVRVFKESIAPGNEAAGALVYRLPNTQTMGAALITDPLGMPYHTDSQGYLQGRGVLNLGDKLVALLPISSASGYTLYATSATPTASGLSMYTVASSGVQNLVVSTTHPLVLFNLDVSLEWDARLDTQFLTQLRFDFQRASELLYDWSNGQAALGNIILYHNRQHWDDAHIRIYASNHRRPIAILGGIVSAAVTDPSVPALLYRPGMVHMGSVWNRYGDPGSSLSEDWPRALAHELGHFALYLDDDYLGLDAANHLISVTSCSGTAMADPYRDDYSELKRQTEWHSGCNDTLAEKTTARADWDTITAFYPLLSGSLLNSGPSSLPLEVTQINEVTPISAPLTLPDPRFYLRDSGGASLQPSASSRAFLFRTNRLVDLGSPTVDSILARGAQPGDKLCVIDPSYQRIGCKTVAAGDDQQLTLNVRTDWQPDLVVTPVTTRTIGLRAGNLPVGLALSARLFAGDGSASSIIALTRSGSDYIGTFNLTNPATEGHVRVWAAADNQKEAVTDFAMGGNPAGMRAGFAGMRAGFAGMRAGFAPSTSADGQVILYTTSLTFPEGQFYTLQAASKLPTPPAWLAPVGQAYWLQRSSGAPDLNGTSLAMGYLPREVPQGEERWLRIYRWTAVNGWQALTTTVVEDQNNAIAVIPGEGLYALFSTVEIPLYGPGWDIFAYTVQTSRPVAEALLSIDGKYNTVYWFNGADPVDPWKVYATGVPGWVIDLSVLQFGEAYWINLTESVTLRLKTGMSAPLTAPSGYPAPPATYYGLVKPGATFIPQAGMPVTAWVNGLLCGQGIVQSQAGKLVYTLNVAADALNTPGCGAPGQLVSFKVGSQQYSTLLWNNDQIWQVDIQPVVQVFLPLVIK